jgi:hypothetical protein
MMVALAKILIAFIVTLLVSSSQTDSSIEANNEHAEMHVFKSSTKTSKNGI